MIALWGLEIKYRALLLWILMNLSVTGQRENKALETNKQKKNSSETFQKNKHIDPCVTFNICQTMIQ